MIKEQTIRLEHSNGQEFIILHGVTVYTEKQRKEVMELYLKYINKGYFKSILMFPNRRISTHPGGTINYSYNLELSSGV